MQSNVSNIASARIKNLKYLLLSGHEVSGELAGHHDSAYRLWQRNWRQTFSELKTDAVLRADDFMRQDVISALFDGEQAVGLLLHTHFNLGLEAIRGHTYLSTYPEQTISSLRAEGSTDVLSMEYLTLDSAWRKSLVGLPLAEVILGLGAKVLESSGFRSMIVVTRNDKRVNEILYGFGARCLVPNLTKHNVAVDIVSLDQGKTHPGQDPEVNRWIDYFWERRTETVSLRAIAQNDFARRAA